MGVAAVAVGPLPFGGVVLTVAVVAVAVVAVASVGVAAARVVAALAVGVVVPRAGELPILDDGCHGLGRLGVGPEGGGAMGGGKGTVFKMTGEKVGHVPDGKVLCFLDHAVGRHAVEEAKRGGVSRV